MSGELDARPLGGVSVLRSPLPQVIIKAPGVVDGGGDVVMDDDGGDETEDEGRGADGRMDVDSSVRTSLPAQPPTASVLSSAGRSGLETPASTLAPLAGDSLATANGWRTPPAPPARRSPPGSGPSEEAAALLLNFSAVGDHPLPTIVERPPPVSGPSYPRTPPHDSPNLGVPSAPSLTSNQTPSSPPGLPTPSAPSPDNSTTASATTTATTRPSKQKRKRNAAAGPSRHSSTEAQSTTERPPHWMGTDNTVIRCICGLTEDDGFTVLCERCNAWEHALCFGYGHESSLPDVFLCELCDPRPLKYSPEYARGLQLRARANYDAGRGVVRSTEEAEPKRRPKTKRPRTTETPKETPDPTEESRDSPSAMGPPATKPKRRSQPGKPRSNAASLKDAQEDEEYFRILPWELEYTPLKDNLIRGRACRQAMTQLYHEWTDAEEVIERKPRPVYADSGLPSPTETGLRLSPDILLSPPDFSILAPPCPPVFLSGPSLTALEAPTSVRPIEESASVCYLPLKYMEPSSGIYPRPTLYGVFALDHIATGGFIGEFRGEILDSASYRQDPINQYAALGVPKPYVRSISHPVNLILDARSYGCEMRFIRSGCHPNAVIKPLFFRPEDSTTPKLRFGVFAAREISKNEEIVLGWEWDDQHVVHTLRAVIDSTLKASPTKPITPPIPAATMELLGTKFDAILTNIFGTFQSCACTVTTDCAFSQMRRLVNKQTFHGVSGQRARKRIDLGELLGAVRGWRKRELEEAAAAKARQYRSSGEWEVWRAGPKDESDKDVDREPSRPQSEAEERDTEAEEEEPRSEGPLEGSEEEKREPVVEVKPVELETAAEPESEAQPVAEPPKESVDPEETDEEMAPVVESVAQPPAATSEDVMDVDEAAPAVETAEPAVETESLVKEAVKEAEVEADGDVAMADEQEPITPVAATADEPPAPSSVLSSVPQDDHPARDDDDDEELSGNESEATTVTIIRSDFSNSEPESDAEVGVRPATTRGGRRGRRVLSPSGDSSSHGSLTPTEEKKEKEEKPTSSRSSRSAPKSKPAPMPPTSTPPRPANDRKRRSRKNVIASSDDDSSANESEPVPSPKPSPKRPAPVSSKFKARKKIKELSDESESEKENIVRPRKVERANSERKSSEKPDSKDSRTDRSRKTDKGKAKEKPDSKSEKEDRKTERDVKEKRADREKEEKRAEREKEREKERKEKKARAEWEEEKAKAEREKEKAAKAEREKEERRAEREKERMEREKEKAERKAAREREEKEKAEQEKLEADKLKDKERADKKTDKSKDKTDKSEKLDKLDKRSDRTPTPKIKDDPVSEDKPVSKSSEKSSEGSEKSAREPSQEATIAAEPKAVVTETKEGTPNPDTKEKESIPAAKESAPAAESTSAAPPPAPAPPKKVSMKEYLATHKIRKHTAPEPPAPTEPPAEAKPKAKEESEEPAAPATVTETETKPASTVPASVQNAARLNLLEHLPSGRSASTPSLGAPFTPAARPLTTSTPSSAYVPRNNSMDHLAAPSPAYAPRPSPSYVPRTLDEPGAAPSGPPHPSPSYGPRDDIGLSPVATRAPLPPVQTPPRPSQSLPEMPSALGARDGPPHHTTPGYGPRGAPPTGPRIPPTGPRSNWGPGPSPNQTPTNPSGPVSPVAPLRPPYPPRGPSFGGPGRGGFGDRGPGWRGRPFRGRGRGM